MKGADQSLQVSRVSLKKPEPHFGQNRQKKGALSAIRICVHAWTDVLEGLSFLDQSQDFMVTDH